MIYAVDFDGTLCNNAWPEIGEANMPLIEYLKKEKENGATLILWTMREGEYLQKALDWCSEKCLHFDAVNDNDSGLKEKFQNNPRKVYADRYIDDHNFDLRGKMFPMQNPFGNDPFAMVWQSFKNLYPDKDCRCWFEVLEKNEDGNEVLGETLFTGEGMDVFVDCRLKLNDAIEIFAHELAHVAAGNDAHHGPEWEEAFEAIFKEYNRLGDEMFESHTPIPDTIDGKSCVKQEEESR